MKRLACSTLYFLLIFCTARLGAQAVYGSIIGTITDSTGAVIPNAGVVITDVSKDISQTVTTNSSGNFEVTHLIPDTYTVKAEAKGFSSAMAGNVLLVAGQPKRVDLQLATAGTTETVTVTTSAAALQTDQADVAQVLDAKQVTTIPNINRNLSQLALLSPGVQMSIGQRTPTGNPQGTVSVEANGSNYGEMGWYLDGTDDREPVLGIIVINPTLDSVGEMRITTQNAPAEFGGAVGGFVSVQTKSGGNQFHGDLFGYRRSGAFQARDPFTQYPGVPFPSSVYGQFGGSMEGPVRKNKTFFFMDYQGTRQRVGNTLTVNVPTLEVRNTCLTGSGLCDLSQYATSVYNPGTQTTYSANSVPHSILTSQGIALLNTLPAPNTGVAGAIVNNYVASGNGNNDGDQADLRLDDQVTASTHAFGRYDYAKYRLLGPAIFGAGGGTGFGLGSTTGTDQVQNQSASVGFDWALNPRLLTDFRFGFLAYHVAQNMLGYGTTPATNAGIPNLNQGTLETSGLPTYNLEDSSISNFGSQGCNCPLLESEQVFQLANNWTVLHDNHSIRFGANLEYARNLRDASNYVRSGVLSFGAGSTTDPTVSSAKGSGLASVLLGYIDTFQRFDVYSQTAANRQKRGALYAQDSWRIKPNLTLNYGVRWDVVFPETANASGMGGFTDLSTGVIRVPGVAGISMSGGADVDLTNLAGRLDLSWQPSSKTVLRVGVATAYDNEGFFGTIFGSSLAINLPVTAIESVTTSNAKGKYIHTYLDLPAKPAAPVVPSNGLIPMQNGISSNWRPNTLVLPKVDQYNLSLQQQLTDDMTLTVAYVGNVAERIYPGESEGFNPNEQVLPTTAAQLSNTNARRPYYNKYSAVYNGTVVQCCNQAISSVFPSARSNYNSMQATLDQRFAHGFTVRTNYTWSKAMNYNSTYFAQKPSVEYGPNDTNRNQLIVLSGIWQLPAGRGKLLFRNAGTLLNKAVGDWQLTGDTRWESGLPFTPTYAECGNDQDVDTSYSSPSASSDCRPDKVSGGTFPMHVGSFNPTTHSIAYFNPVASLSTYGSTSGPFARPAFGTIGNYGRNSLRGPSEYFANAALSKNFTFRERVKGEFQFQTFNLFNHVPLGLPSAANARCIDCSAANTGKITSADSTLTSMGMPYMRTLQFSVRLQF